MSKRILQALRVDFELGGPMVVPDRHPVMLDALLLALLGRRFALPFPPAALPLQAASSDAWSAGEFVWLASALEIRWVGPATDRYLSRNARTREILGDAATHGGTTADSSRGMSKVTRKRVMVRHAERAVAWCIGDLAGVQAMLTNVVSIGAQRHLGFGLVKACSVCADKAGSERAWRRPLPGPHAQDPYRDARLQIAGRATPPYWDRDLSQNAWWPELIL